VASWIQEVEDLPREDGPVLSLLLHHLVNQIIITEVGEIKAASMVIPMVLAPTVLRLRDLLGKTTHVALGGKAALTALILLLHPGVQEVLTPAEAAVVLPVVAVAAADLHQVQDRAAEDINQHQF
jgi:ABC-type transport system involved in cytochrome bd biosynthesis fused ATPase/permease subunit